MLNYPVLPRRTEVEEALASAVAPLGTMVAIGQPGESLPLPGAIRSYASENEWREVVDKWLSMARLVILRAGATEGVWWETQRVVATVRPRKVLILTFGLDQSTYKSFAERMHTAFGIHLPGFTDVQRWRSVSGFFEFDDDWTPRFLAIRAPYLRTPLYTAMEAFFHYTLRPVFVKLGVGWSPLPVAATKVIFISVEACFLFVIVIGLCLIFLLLLLIMALLLGASPDLRKIPLGAPQLAVGRKAGSP